MNILNVLLLNFLENLKYTTTIQNEKTKFKRVQMVDDYVGKKKKEAISHAKQIFSINTTDKHTQILILKQLIFFFFFQRVRWESQYRRRVQ